MNEVAERAGAAVEVVADAEVAEDSAGRDGFLPVGPAPRSLGQAVQRGS